MTGWTDRQVKEFSRGLRKAVGDGWRWLTGGVRQALVAERVLQIVLGQHRAVVEIADVESLYRRMLVACGCEDEP